MTHFAIAPLCESCGEIIQPWRRAWSTLCDGCEALAPKGPLRGIDAKIERFDPLPSYGFGVSTNILENGLIEQVTLDLTGEIYRRVMNTAEEQVRMALIKLGWTPPPEPKEETHD